MADTEGHMESNGVSTQGMAKRKSVIIHGHPALLQWTPPRTHALNATQFEAITAICDAYIPSFPPPGESCKSVLQGVKTEDVATFFKLKASDADIIDVVAATLPLLMRPDVVKPVYLVLKLLGTGWGTCALACTGGVNTITRKHPGLRKFSKLTPREQEKILQGWSRSPISQIRQMFKAFKSIVGWAFYSKSNEDCFENVPVVWKAIGYAPVDPVVRERTEADYTKPRPLGNNHIDAMAAGAGLKPALVSKGFSVVEQIVKLHSQDSLWEPNCSKKEFEGWG